MLSEWLLLLRLLHPVNTGAVLLLMPGIGLFHYAVAVKGCGWLLISILISLLHCEKSFVKFTLFCASDLLLQAPWLSWPSNGTPPRPLPLPLTGVCEWVTPLLRHGRFGLGLRWLFRASQTYATQLCSIMSDQHLHNLYPSYSLRTNHALFFLFFFPSTRGPWIIYISKIYLFCWSQWLLSLLSHLSFMMERVRKGRWLN